MSDGIWKFIKDLFQGDIHSIVNHAVNDIIAPTIKKTMWELGADSWHMFWYGDPRSNAPMDKPSWAAGNNKMRQWNGYTISNGYPQNPVPMQKEFSPQSASQSQGNVVSTTMIALMQDYKDVTFESRLLAEHALDVLKERILTKRAMGGKGYVTVLEFFNLPDVQISCEFTAADFGWDDLSTAVVCVKENGYVIKFPQARPIADILKK